MRRDFFKLRPRILFSFMIGMAVILGSAGCWNKSGKALALEKEHIAAREIIATPKAEQIVSSKAPAPNEKEKPRELGKDEIVVETYVMKKDARGTSRDPRAMSEEQWIVKVQMIDDLRQLNVQIDKLHWDRVKVGDRIKISYRQGKYTGTFWAAEID